MKLERRPSSRSLIPRVTATIHDRATCLGQITRSIVDEHVSLLRGGAGEPIANGDPQ